MHQKNGVHNAFSQGGIWSPKNHLNDNTTAVIMAAHSISSDKQFDRQKKKEGKGRNRNWEYWNDRASDTINQDGRDILE